MELHVIKDDITQLKVDAIVNAANEALLPGGGVCGAIHSAAGPKLESACRELKGCPTGQAKITNGYSLPAKYIIHTVGPVWQGGASNEAELLASCYRNSLQLAVQHGITTIAFPAISCGIFGYPIEQAAKIAIQTTRAFLASHDKIESVYFVCFDDETYKIYKKLLH